MAKFEYKTMPLGMPLPKDLEKTLNKLGAQGWELVSVIPSSSIVSPVPAEGCYGVKYENEISYVAFLKRVVE